MASGAAGLWIELGPQSAVFSSVAARVSGRHRLPSGGTSGCQCMQAEHAGCCCVSHHSNMDGHCPLIRIPRDRAGDGWHFKVDSKPRGSSRERPRCKRGEIRIAISGKDRHVRSLTSPKDGRRPSCRCYQSHWKLELINDDLSSESLLPQFDGATQHKAHIDTPSCRRCNHAMLSAQPGPPTSQLQLGYRRPPHDPARELRFQESRQDTSSKSTDTRRSRRSTFFAHARSPCLRPAPQIQPRFAS